MEAICCPYHNSLKKMFALEGPLHKYCPHGSALRNVSSGGGKPVLASLCDQWYLLLLHSGEGGSRGYLLSTCRRHGVNFSGSCSALQQVLEASFQDSSPKTESIHTPYPKARKKQPLMGTAHIPQACCNWCDNSYFGSHVTFSSYGMSIPPTSGTLAAWARSGVQKPRAEAPCQVQGRLSRSLLHLAMARASVPEGSSIPRGIQGQVGGALVSLVGGSPAQRTGIRLELDGL